MVFIIIQEQRKIQLTGGSTFIISLPIKWIRDVGLSTGDSLTLTPQPDKTLLISPEPKNEERIYKATIKLFPGDDPEDNFRVLVAHYLVGYNIIKLKSQKGFNASDRKIIKDAVRQRLIGLEVVEESRNELILQSLLNYRDLPLDKAMQSMSGLVSAMLEDVMRALCEHDLELARDIIQRDDEVDRFYLLTVRQIKAAIEDPLLSEKIGIDNPRECLGYRIVTKSIERVGDHIERIAHIIIRMDQKFNKNDQNNQIIEMGQRVHGVFIDAIKSLYLDDVKYANIVIAHTNDITDISTSIIQKNRNDTDSHTTGTEIRSIIESLHRVSEYSADIAEISININTKALKEQ